jgi:hypothetical protein
MKISFHRPSGRRARQNCAGEIMAEAAIGLSLMAFVWILISYIFYMGDYKIRTEMAARYAAWYQGATSGSSAGSTPATAQLDSNFFYQTGLSTVTSKVGENLANPFTGTNSTAASAEISDSGGPFLVTVTFGVTDPTSTSNPYPFDLLSTQVLFNGWTNTMFANFFSVSSSCQWDEIGNTWNTPGEAFSGLINMVEQAVESFL